MTMTVLGATGMIGSRLVAEAARRGHSVIAVSRSGAAVNGASSAIAMDLGDTAKVVAAIDSSDATVIAIAPDRAGGSCDAAARPDDHADAGGALAGDESAGRCRDRRTASRARRWTPSPPHRSRAIVRNAAREFAKAELANHRYVLVLHTHQANPHVRLAVRAEGRDGSRLNPRKHDLRRWREVFAEKLRGWGIEAEASSQVTRGSRHRTERLWQRKAYDDGRGSHGGSYVDPKVTPARRHAAQAWCEIAKALASSDDLADRELGRSVVNYARWLPGVRYKPPEKQPQRELPGLERTLPQKTRPEPGWER